MPASDFATRRPVGLAMALLVVSAALHLTALSYPRAVVFDEVHFGRFATAYACTHQYFFDLHPPHAKLLIAGASRLLGYRCNLSFTRIGEPYGASPVPLRIVPALAGTALPVVFFAILIQLGATPAAALLGGILVTFDNALTVHTRLIQPDGILVASIFGALSAWLQVERARSARRGIGWSVVAGCLAGVAAGSKFVGLGAIGLIGVLALQGMVLDRSWPSLRRRLLQAGCVAGAAVTVYLLGWMLHFALLDRPGPGDVWGVPSGDLLADIVAVHRTMLAANVGLHDSHPYASAWWSWPLMLRPIFYWVAPGSRARMYLVGNPVVWWGAAVLFLAVLVTLALSRVTTRGVQPAPGRDQRPPRWIPYLGFAAFYVPMMGIHRVMFVYHYFTPLLFSLMAVVLWLDRAGWTRPGSLARQRASYHVTIAVVVLSFAALAPLTYGLEAGQGVADLLFRVFPSWR